MRLSWCVSGFLLLGLVYSSGPKLLKTLEEQGDEAEVPEAFTLSHVEEFLNGFNADLTIYEVEEGKALQKLDKLDMGLFDIATLFLLTRNQTGSVSQISSIFFEKSMKSLNAGQAVVFAYNCYFDVIKSAVPYILNEKFTFSIEKSLLSGSHFLYECLLINAELKFVVYGWDQLQPHTKFNVMCDLVGPDRKSIVQILIENNRADWLLNLPELIENSVYLSRSVILWLESPKIILNPLFWISKGTSIEVLEAYGVYPEVFMKFDGTSNSILHHAIEQECKPEVIEFIVVKCGLLKNYANYQGICPLQLAYWKRSYAIMEILCRHFASQCFYNGKVSTVLRQAILDNDIRALKILLEGNDFYWDDMIAFKIAKKIRRFEAARLLLTIVHRCTEEEAERIIKNF